MAVRGESVLVVRGEQDPPTPYSEAAVAALALRVAWGDGVSDRQFRKPHQSSTSIAASGNSGDVSLVTRTDPYGTSIAATDVAVIVFTAPETNDDEIRIKPGGANPWTALFTGTTPYISLWPGAAVALIAPKAGKYLLTATSKTLLFANQSAAQANAIGLIMLARN